MGHPNEELVRKGYEAFSSGDMETLGKLMKPDVVHSVPGESLISGEHKGQDEVFELYGKLFELSDGTVAVELLEVTAQGDDKVVAKHRNTAKRGDKTIEALDTIEFTIEDGKISRLDETTEDQAATDAFWS
jgi:hypothetical protein